MPLSRLSYALCTVALAFVAACGGGGDDGDATPPAGLPDGARDVATFETDASVTIESMACDADILQLDTSGELIRAELPCDRMPPEDVVEMFVGASATIALREAETGAGCPGTGACGKLRVQTEDDAILEFTVGRTFVSD